MERMMAAAGLTRCTNDPDCNNQTSGLVVHQGKRRTEIKVRDYDAFASILTARSEPMSRIHVRFIYEGSTVFIAKFSATIDK